MDYNINDAAVEIASRLSIKGEDRLGYIVRELAKAALWGEKLGAEVLKEVKACEDCHLVPCDKHEGPVRASD